MKIIEVQPYVVSQQLDHDVFVSRSKASHKDVARLVHRFSSLAVALKVRGHNSPTEGQNGTEPTGHADPREHHGAMRAARASAE